MVKLVGPDLGVVSVPIWRSCIAAELCENLGKMSNMSPDKLASYLSEKGFSVKQVPLVNTLGKLGKDGVNTFDLTSNFCDKFIGSKFWTCGKCSKMYDSQTSLYNHIRVDHFGMNVTSGIVNLSSGVTGNHIKVENGETSYIIIKTDQQSDSLEFKKRRSRRVETKPRKPYEKRYLDIKARTEISGPFKCNICNEIFSDCCNFSTHMNNLHFKRRRLILRCQICEKKYMGKMSDDSVKVPYEPGPPTSQLNCNMCGKVFTLQAHLDYHVKKYHSKIKQYECSLCNKSFTQPSICYEYKISMVE
ncbi:uncharacterized protein LOC143909414 isoform X2 [Arctopsyche grandis]|uniref:uncharacterized protein LOC143909414 isoform X2 n=1 Tax=Arctopsyche grandis TaxID=121162 RepID=UPI00406D664D